MAGETIKATAICLGIRPWSRTSHIVSWLTPLGRVVTVVKGAVRPKSQFLGQYDANYTCEIVYYARARGEIHALRECLPVDRRDALRGDYRALALAEYFRFLVSELVPSGPEAEEWQTLLTAALDGVVDRSTPVLAKLLDFEMKVLELSGLSPDFSNEKGEIVMRGERRLAVSPETVSCLNDPLAEKNVKILLDAARVIGVFYDFHVDVSAYVRRTVLELICK